MRQFDRSDLSRYTTNKVPWEENAVKQEKGLFLGLTPFLLFFTHHSASAGLGHQVTPKLQEAASAPLEHSSRAAQLKGHKETFQQQEGGRGERKGNKKKKKNHQV